jgi:hypothetical protein
MVSARLRFRVKFVVGIGDEGGVLARNWQLPVFRC